MAKSLQISCREEAPFLTFSDPKSSMVLSSAQKRPSVVTELKVIAQLSKGSAYF